MTELDRRGLLKAACIGCAALGLAACGGSSSPSSAADAQPSAAGGASPAPAGGPAVIIPLAAIPVGGSAAGRAASGKRLVLARPTATTVVAFSSTCTHQQCTVEPNGKKYSCPCHGSEYDAFTGKNLSGPAPSPLSPVAVKISGADVVEA